MSRPLCIYAGYFVRYPLGGHLLAELSYIAGLQRLGYDVIVVEESGSAWAPCYDPDRNEMTADPTVGIGILKNLLRPLGLENRWCYVDATGYHGLSADELRAACRRARVVFNRAGVTWLEEFRECPRRIFVDVDPGFTQFRLANDPLPSASGYASPRDFQFHFTFAERIGAADCSIPTLDLTWRPTRQPVALELVPVRFTPDAKNFSTVLSWSAYGNIEHDGQTYGQKGNEMLKLLDLPGRTGVKLEIALAGPNAPAGQLREAGWIISDPLAATRTVDAYLDFIGNSRGEFSVAKNAYVQTRSGWFSDRTAAYLASGKPVVVQDTGFSEQLPCGEGLFAFRDAADALGALETIERDYPRQCRAARRIAEEHFAAEKVIGKLLAEAEL
jgi:hypothetical protein